jgi:hypothetical protein
MLRTALGLGHVVDDVDGNGAGDTVALGVGGLVGEVFHHRVGAIVGAARGFGAEVRV